ncbi:dienelactone hydrolase family protein [Pandoraea norimbergensis]|uniref:Dienelactone hydrolase domain-containing protein n=1 Tax=Pandoraea norimbergensis TaxID=93219 RepID=A0ABN4JH45_9BURK|nr:dienelactone hydrolase family protein [Pandoraea norimbergensis]
MIRVAAGSLLSVLITSVLVACASTGTGNSAVTTSLADGRSGVITFASVTPRSTGDFLANYTGNSKAIIEGTLTLPENAPPVVPAVIILHGSSGVNPGERVWAARMNALGYASFIVDSFTGRGIRNTEKDQTQLSMAADIADAYAALRLLATDPRIDKRRIAVMGFSRGGFASLYSALAPFQQRAADDDLRFAAHVAFYPSCGISYESARLDGAPILMLVGGKDNYTPAAPCVAYADTLRAKGAQVVIKEYPNAYHAFDRPTSIRSVPLATSGRECHGVFNLDRRSLTMTHDGQSLTGAAATAESKRCLTRGVTMGGDPQGQAESPADVAAFLQTAFR